MFLMEKDFGLIALNKFLKALPDNGQINLTLLYVSAIF